MAGEVLLINPRRRRGRRRKASRSHARKRAPRRRRRLVASNPRRRRRVHARRHARRRGRRIHRNPRLPLIGSVNIGGIAAGTAGYVGTRYGTGFLLGVLPDSWKAANPDIVRIGAKAVVGLVALPFLANLLKLRGASGAIRTGAGIAIGVDIFETYLAKMIPLPMSDYEQGYITSYEAGQITGTGDMDVVDIDAYGGSAYGA
jgi:hypothetical protein